MDERDDWALRPDPVPDEPPWRPVAHRLRDTTVLVFAALLLVATGAGLALALSGASDSPGPSRAGLYAVSRPRGQIDTRKLARAIDPAVVDISAVIATPAGPADVAGTGMLVTSTGMIVTNNHVIENATTIKVELPGTKRHYLASFVGADPSADIAVVRVAGVRHLPTVRFGSSSQVQVGEAVLAFGNSLGLGGVASVTVGSVSALGRSITATSETGADAEHLQGMIETDAPIAPGNSGGPLVNARGFVIGMNTAAASTGTPAGVPVAFALPADRVARIVKSIESRRSGGGVVIGRSAYLGIEGTTTRLVGQRQAGAVDIVQVEPSTPAAGARLEPGDLILRLGGSSITSMSRLSSVLSRFEPGDHVEVVFEFQGFNRTIHLRLVAGPAP